MKVQRGKNELLEPTDISDSSIEFDFEVTVDLGGEAPNFLGKYAQGPKDARFVYVNSGTSAGQFNTIWTRRAKLSLMSITRSQIEAVIESRGSRLAAVIDGIGNDGGPVCASVKGLEWKVEHD